MLSPVTGSTNVSLCEDFPVQEILGQYANEYHVDVSRFFKNLARIELYRCEDSGCRFYYPESIFGDGTFYEALQKNKGYYSVWTWQHDQASKFLKNGATILEVGCGLGEFLARRRGANECVGLELNPSAVIAARNKGLTIFNESIESHSANHQGAYDVVCAFQVFEHIYNARSFLHSSLECLKPDGLLILSVPNNHPYVCKYDRMHTLNLPPHHAALWNEESLQRLELFFPMRVVDIAVEPVVHVHEHARALRKHWCKSRSILRWLPRRSEVLWYKIIRPLLKGRDIVVVYSKKK